jgi:hypothetical protein
MTNNRRTASAVLEVPDVLGDEGRTAIYIATLRDIQATRTRLQVSMAVNDHDDADIVPGTEDKDALGREVEGTGKTYATRLEEVAAFERRFMDNYGKLLT